MKRSREKTVKVAELKARLSEYLRGARRGHSITVCDRETPIARLVPFVERESLPVRQPLRGLRDVELPPPLGRPVDRLSMLLEERQQSR
jgi:prevent-host-death family protein